MLVSVGYVEVRQRGSHVRLTRVTESGQHHITVPDHRVIAKGTLNDILTAVSARTSVAKRDLIARLK